jgi:hypothetical protein
LEIRLGYIRLPKGIKNLLRPTQFEYHFPFDTINMTVTDHSLNFAYIGLGEMGSAMVSDQC